MLEVVKTVAFIISGVAVAFVAYLIKCDRRTRGDRDEHY